MRSNARSALQALLLALPVGAGCSSSPATSSAMDGSAGQSADGSSGGVSEGGSSGSATMADGGDAASQTGADGGSDGGAAGEAGGDAGTSACMNPVSSAPSVTLADFEDRKSTRLNSSHVRI